MTGTRHALVGTDAAGQESAPAMPDGTENGDEPWL